MEENRRKLHFGLGSLFVAVAVVAAIVWLVQLPMFWMAVAEVALIAVLMSILLVPLLVIGLVLEFVRRRP